MTRRLTRGGSGVPLVRAVAVGVGLAIALAGPARAQDAASSTVVYRVKKDDSLALLAAEHYGDHTKQIFIMVENRIAHPRPLRPGERLRIPIPREITTQPGDTFASLAATYLGDARRGTFLADFNGLPVDDVLAAGTKLDVLFTVTHVANGVESLASISLAYFGTDKHTDLLRRYNARDKQSLDRGEAIQVPVFTVRPPAAKLPALDAEAKARRERRRMTAALAANAVPVARQAWRVGEYASVKTALAEIDVDYLDTAQAVDVGVLLGCAHVAFDEEELALAAFKRVIARRPSHRLRGFDFSPKILKVWTTAGGQTQ